MKEALTLDLNLFIVVFCLFKKKKIWPDLSKECITIALEEKLFDFVKENNGNLTRIEIIEQCGFGKRGGEAVINLLTALSLFLKVFLYFIKFQL